MVNVFILSTVIICVLKPPERVSADVTDFYLAQGMTTVSGRASRLDCMHTESDITNQAFLDFYKESQRVVNCLALNDTICTTELYQDRYIGKRINGTVLAVSINSVQQSDAGTWKCLIRSTSKGRTYNFTVQVPVSSVNLTSPSGDPVTVNESQVSLFVCRTSGCFPEATVRWFKAYRTPVGSSNDSEIIANITTTKMSDNGLIIVTSTLHYIPNRLDADTRIYCTATNLPDASAMSALKPRLVVQFPPNGPPVILEGHQLKIIENTTLQLNCSATGGYPLPVLTWDCFRGRDAYSTSQQTVTSVFTWTSIRNEDRTCTCKSDHYSGAQYDSIAVEVLYPVTTPTLQTNSQNIYDEAKVIVGNSLYVICTSYGKGPPSYTWKYKQSSVRNASISITDVKISNNGEIYICEASNTMSPTGKVEVTAQASASFKLTVLYAPAVDQLKMVDIEEGHTLSQMCVFREGNPSDTIVRWTREIDNRSWISGNLSIANVSRNDASNYTCTVYNTMKPIFGAEVNGSDFKSFTLNVWYSPSVSNFTLNGTAGSMTVEENDTNIFVKCNVDSNPASNITLEHNNHALRTLSGENSLEYTVPQVNCTDTGHFKCIGYNRVNTRRASADISFFVRCSPRPSPFVPLKEHVRSKLHVSATLSFTALAYPVPDTKNVTWYREQTLIAAGNSENFSISTDGLQSNLTIVNLTRSFFGNYTLKIQNEIDSWKQAFSIEPYDVPNTPTQFRNIFEKTTTSSVTLQWTAGFNGGPEQIFVLQYKKAGTQQWTTVNITHHEEIEMAYMLQHLSMGTEYEIVLFAANEIGPSKQSQNITVTTLVIQSPPGVNAALIGGAVGGAAGFVMITFAVVLAVCFKRRLKKSNSTDKSQLAMNSNGRQQADEDSSDEDVVVENKMYESAGQIEKDGPVYSKPANKVKVATKNTDVYAVVDKPKMKDNQKAKKEKPKKTKQFAHGDIYENAPKSQTGNNTYGNAAFDDNPYENPEGSKPFNTQKKNINPDGLIYADLAFNDQPKGQKKLVIHGLDEMTTYVQVDFNKKADPLPDSDTEEKSESKKN